MNEQDERKDINSNEQTEIIKEKCGIYFESKTVVHILCKNESFYNGIIQDIKSSHIIFNDNKLGNLPLTFREIKVIEPYVWLFKKDGYQPSGYKP